MNSYRNSFQFRSIQQIPLNFCPLRSYPLSIYESSNVGHSNFFLTNLLHLILLTFPSCPARLFRWKCSFVCLFGIYPSAFFNLPTQTQKKVNFVAYPSNPHYRRQFLLCLRITRMEGANAEIKLRQKLWEYRKWVLILKLLFLSSRRSEQIISHFRHDLVYMESLFCSQCMYLNIVNENIVVPWQIQEMFHEN